MAAEDKDAPRPDPALKRLEPLVGRWKLQGRPLGADADSITGTTEFAWLHDIDGARFFLRQDMAMDYAGTQIHSHEVIGHDPATKAFASYVYSNMAPDPWPYKWNVEGDDITISIEKDAMNARFTGKFAADRRSFSGGWRPNPGADPEINAPYDITATRID